MPAQEKSDLFEFMLERVKETQKGHLDSEPCGAEANRWEHHNSAYRLAHIATERRPRALPALPALRYPAPSRLWLGGDSFSGWSNGVEQSQEYQLAMPILCSTALLIRRRVSVWSAHVSRS